MEFDQAVIIPIISEIENPAIVGPSKNDGMLGLGKDGCWLDLLRTFGRTDLLLNRGEVRWQWQLVLLPTFITKLYAMNCLVGFKQIHKKCVLDYICCFSPSHACAHVRFQSPSSTK